MKKPTAFLFTIASAFTLASASGQTAIAPPQIGFIQDRMGSFRQISGLAGNFILGPAALTGVVSAAFSGSFAFIKTNPSIQVTDAQGHMLATVGAPGGPAQFAFSADGHPALAYVTNSNALFQWTGGTLVSTPLDSAIGSDRVWSIAAPDPEHAAFLVERPDGLWNIRVLLATGKIDSQAALPGLNAPALLLANGVIVSTEPNGLLVTAPDASQIHIAAQLPRTFSLQQIGDGWLQLQDLAKLSRTRDLAVRVVQNHAGIYTLPEVAQ